MRKIQIDVLAVKKQAEKTMTMQEIADAMGVSKDTIRNCVRRVFPDKMQQGKTAYFNEAEVAIISKELKSNAYVSEQLTSEAASQVKNTTTRLEVLANYKAATQAMIELLEAEKAELQAEKERIASERDKLAIELDSAKEWATVKRMEALNPKMRFSWRALKRYAMENGYKMKDVFDQNYGTVKAYPRAVWEAVYGEQIDEAPWLE